MRDWSGYLLRSDAEDRAYLKRHGDFYRRAAIPWMEWVRRLDFVSWARLDLREEDAEAVIGCLCLLYQRRHIWVTFNGTATALRRDPYTGAEWEEWRRQTGLRP